MSLPNGWIFTLLSDISDNGLFCDGDWVETKDQDPNGEVRLIQLADVGEGNFNNRSSRFLTKEKAIELKCTFLVEGDILIARMPKPLGRACIFPLNQNEKFVTVVDVAILRTNKQLVLNKFCSYIINSPQFRTEIASLESGTTRKRISRKNLNTIPFPLPPLPEQYRIVEKIDALFSELDKGVETLLTIKQQLKVYRQTVLKWAFEGKLTTDWRKANHQSRIEVKNALDKTRISTIAENADGSPTYLQLCNDWLWTSMGDIFPVEVGATPSRRIPEFWDGDINWVSSGEVKFTNIFTTEEKITCAGLQNSSTNLQPTGTVLLAMIGEGKTRGQAAIIKNPSAHNQNTAAIIVPKTEYSTEYLYYYLRYNYQYTRRVGSGNNQKALNKDRVKQLPFPFTTKNEQDAVVAAIESRLSICDKLEQLVNETLAKTEALRQSILKKAFSGQLVPQDSNDEPAEKLLERIRTERTETAKRS